MKPTSVATYERARRLANNAMFSVALQCRRLGTSEPEDKEFIFRKWADFDFLVVALIRLRRAAALAAKVKEIQTSVLNAINEFDTTLPNLKTMRDVAEHIDDYALDQGKKRAILRKSLGVSKMSRDGSTLEWLGGHLNTQEALIAAEKLFRELQNVSSVFTAQA